MRAIALCIVILGLAFMTPAFVGAQAVTLAYWHRIPKPTNDLETRLSHEFEQRNPDVHVEVRLIEDADLNTTLLTAMGGSNGDYCGRNPSDPRCPHLP
jgi:ABC-type glycerol-3-phosphate transport system substrate-binding protein